MVKLFSKIAKLYIPDTSKKEPFAVFIDDGDGFHIKGLKKEMKKHPKLKELTSRHLLSKRLSQLEEGDVLLFGDSPPSYKYDYRVIEMQDLISVDDIDQYDLTLDYKEVIAAIKKYHKNNYPLAYSSLRKRSRKQQRTTQQQPVYYSRTTGKRVKDVNLQLEIPKVLLSKYGKVEVEIPRSLLKRSSSSLLPDEELVERKKKVNKKQYVVHQSFVKVGLKGYNIYTYGKKNKERVNVNGKTYGIVRRSGKKDFLVEL